MKIEYMKETSNGSLIRIFDFSNQEVLEFERLLKDLVLERITSLELHKHCNINPKDNAHLTFFVGIEDRGITGKKEEFHCVLTKKSYQNMIELVASFALHPIEFKGYEWLDETSDVSLLISPDGQW